MIIQSFNVVFVFVQVMTRGGLRGATEVIQTYLYKQTFEYGNFGYGTAIGVVAIVGLLILSNSIFSGFKEQIS